jgi:hypothetical protein
MCFGASDAGDPNFYVTWMKETGAWVSVSFTTFISMYNLYRYSITYVRKICNDKKNYINAYTATNALFGRSLRNSQPEIFARSGIGLDHLSYYDRFRSLNHEHYQSQSLVTNPVEIDKGDYVYFFYDNSNYQYRTNGGYVIFTGTLNNDWSDFNAVGEIKITIKYWDGSSYKFISRNSVTTWDVKNHFHLPGNPPNPTRFNGRSTICSTYITASEFKQHDEFLIMVDFTSSDPATSKIRVDRLEIMEIGRKK